MKKKKKRERAGKVPGTKCKYKKEVKNRKKRAVNVDSDLSDFLE